MRKIFYLSSCSTCKRIINELQNINQFDLHITFSPAIAFFIGYSGMRLIPMMERKVSKALDKLG